MKVRDKQTGKIETVIDKTINSFCVTRTKLTEDGINCTQWFTQGDFYKKFEQVIKEPESAPTKVNLSKILIVEDNTVNQLVMKKMLKNTGIEIDIADNGKIGFEKVLQNKYDLVFMDLLMPEMDGYEATKEIRNFNKDIPIVALTADVMKGVEAKTKEAGMNNYLTKPVKKDELLKILSLYSN